MKLGHDTGSLVNAILARHAPVTPVVGMGATILHWTDRDPATVVAVRHNGATVDIQQDKAHRLDSNGMSETQVYEYIRNPSAPVRTFTLRRNGEWIERGSPRNGGTRLALGHRERYHDYSF